MSKEKKSEKRIYSLIRFPHGSRRNIFEIIYLIKEQEVLELYDLDDN